MTPRLRIRGRQARRQQAHAADLIYFVAWRLQFGRTAGYPAAAARHGLRRGLYLALRQVDLTAGPGVGVSRPVTFRMAFRARLDRPLRALGELGVEGQAAKVRIARGLVRPTAS